MIINLFPSRLIFVLFSSHVKIDPFVHIRCWYSVVIYLEHIIETDYHAPPVGDFGYGRGGMAEGFRDTFESWETSGGGAYSMNTMFADGGLQTDYELSNITSVSMTPNGKYAIVGQSQGPPQIWDAVVRRKWFPYVCFSQPSIVFRMAN